MLKGGQTDRLILLKGGQTDRLILLKGGQIGRYRRKVVRQIG